MENQALTIEGNTPIDKAYHIWHEKMNPDERMDIANKFKGIGSIAKRYRACLNHIAINLEKY